ncbi:MAG: DUF4012 domain-containing protein [Patescibacteria group bacterium]|nr:DUF4012 domain-containing protein [Patescibacteria group bacterium]
MEVKKHKIKISSDGQTSGFVLDLRLEKNKDGENKNNSFSKKIDKDISFEIKKEKDKKNSIVSEELRKNSEELKRNIRKHLFPTDNNKKNNKLTSFFLKLKKTFLSPFFIFIFKIGRAILWFFVDWGIDIYYFFKNIFSFRRGQREGIKRVKSKRMLTSRPPRPVSPPVIRTKIFSAKKRKKTIWLFALILLILVIPFKIFSYYRLATEDKTKDKLLQYSSSGIENFVLASREISELDLSQAQKNFFQAGENFLLLDEELKKIDEFIILLASFSGDEKIKLASESKKIAKIGINLALAGDNFSLAIDSLLGAFAEGEVDVDEKFSDFYYYTTKAEKDFKNVNKYLGKIKESSLPEDYREQFVDIKNKSKVLEKNLEDLIRILPGLKDFLAINSDKRYLVVFQNNAEMRATGGFIGSYALVDLKKGKIKNIEIPAGGSYDTEGGMRVIVESPQPLHVVKPVWYFWDANWWPDWKMSAQNLMWFYEKSGGPSVDGVISLTPDVLADVLRVIGPVDMTEKYGVVINSDNFWEIMQEIVEVIGQPEIYQDKDLKTDILQRVSTSTQLATTTEQKLVEGDKTEDEQELFLRNEPKKIIGDLMSKLLFEFSSNFNRELLVSTLGIMEKNLTQKNILLYFNNSKMQTEIENRSWAGRVKEAPLDYLMVVNSSVAGGKTDYFIDNDFSLKVDVAEDGSIINKLTIKRHHRGIKGDLFSGQRNVNWLRVYVPLGSSLISANGFSSLGPEHFKVIEGDYEKNEILESSENKAEIDLLSNARIYQESNKTVFANWNIVDPGEESIIEITYKLPYNFYSLLQSQESTWMSKLFPTDPSCNYSLLWQKQAGASSSDLKVDFSSKLKLDPVWTYPDNISGNFSEIEFRNILNSDRYFVIMLK